MIRRLFLGGGTGAKRDGWAMDPVVAIIHLTSLYPLTRALRANRKTTLSHALGWTGAAWLAWGGVFVNAWRRPEEFSSTASYLALALTGCAGMAVLGARRPGLTAWNFVVAGLLAVLLLPLAEGWGEPRLGPLRTSFLTATILVVPFNYLPTRFGLAALLLATGCGIELAALLSYTAMSELRALDSFVVWGRILVAISPWVAWGLMKGKRRPLSEFDQLWLDFRDRFGLTWTLRLREQFNRAAANASWSVHLGWSGLQGRVGDEMLSALQALLKRFGR
jgi:hypothetical protein